MPIGVKARTRRAIAAPRLKTGNWPERFHHVQRRRAIVGARHRTSTTAAGAAILLSLATGGSIIGAQAAGAAVSGRTPLKGSAVTATARKHAVGAVAKSARVSFRLVLKLRDASGAKSLVRAIS